MFNVGEETMVSELQLQISRGGLVNSIDVKKSLIDVEPAQLAYALPSL